MNPDALQALLRRLQQGEIEVKDVLAELATLPFADLGFARVDHHRALRQGLPEVIFAQEKTAEQVVAIAREMLAHGANLLITRLSPDKGQAVCAALPALNYSAIARTATHGSPSAARSVSAPVLVLTAGTSDGPVAAEACVTLEACGVRSELIQDVGVAGLQRILAELARLRSAPAIIVIAGMEGALASVVGGLVACPVVAVPTSVGYGAAFEGVAALLGMMTSCAAGITVVNIDNGFGAAVAVVRMLRGQPQQP